MEIQDNYLPYKQFRELQDFLLGPYVPWIYNNTITGSETSKMSGYQFIHSFFNTANPLLEQPPSSYTGVLRNLLFKLRAANLLKVKANLRPCTTEIEGSGFHVDLPIRCTTAIYYINTCNGYTEFEDDGTRVESVENRLMIFDSARKHMGTTCTDQKRRVVLNINYVPSLPYDGRPIPMGLDEQGEPSLKNAVNF